MKTLFSLATVLVTAVFCGTTYAQAAAAPAAPNPSAAPIAPPVGAAPTANRVPAPELQPTLPSSDNARVSSKDSAAQEGDSTANAAASDVVKSASEERIESRLALIHGKGFTVTDPNAGRYDRASGNGQRRVAPSMWQLFRF